MAERVRAYNRCEVLCITNPISISRIFQDNYSYQPYYGLEKLDNTYKTILCGIEIKPCNIMRTDQLFLFPYEFKDGFPYVCGTSGIMQFW